MEQSSQRTLSAAWRKRLLQSPRWPLYTSHLITAEWYGRWRNTGIAEPWVYLESTRYPKRVVVVVVLLLLVLVLVLLVMMHRAVHSVVRVVFVSVSFLVRCVVLVVVLVLLLVFFLVLLILTVHAAQKRGSGAP